MFVELFHSPSSRGIALACAGMLVFAAIVGRIPGLVWMGGFLTAFFLSSFTARIAELVATSRYNKTDRQAERIGIIVLLAMTMNAAYFMTWFVDTFIVPLTR